LNNDDELSSVDMEEQGNMRAMRHGARFTRRLPRKATSDFAYCGWQFDDHATENGASNAQH
jgi:hypothetical protein